VAKNNIPRVIETQKKHIKAVNVICLHFSIDRLALNENKAKHYLEEKIYRSYYN